MQNRNEELVRNSLLLSIGTLIPKVLSLIILPIVTGCLTKEEYGKYDLIITAVSLIVPVITLQIQQAAFRFLIGTKDSSEREKYIITALAYIVFISVLTAPITFCIFYFILNYSIRISGLVCLIVFAESLYLLAGQMLRGLGNNLKYSIGVIVYSIVNFLTVLILIYVLKLGFSGIVLSITFSYLFASLFLLWCIFGIEEFEIASISKYSLIEMLKFSTPILPSSISLWIVNLSDRLIVTAVLGAAANGVYSIANKIPVLYSTAYGIFNLAWTETAARVSDTDDKPEIYYGKLFSKLFSFLIGIMLFVIAISPIIYKYLINAQYYASYYQTAILYFGGFFNSLVAFYAGIYIALKRTKQVGISSAMGAAINFAINIGLIHSIGLYAASISTALSYLIILLYRAYDINKVIKLKYNYIQIFLGMGVFIISTTLFYQRTIVSTAICFVIAISYNLIYNRYMIGWVLKRIK